VRITKKAAGENKDRVVKAAGRLIREKGFGGLGVAGVMREAGLTHGGFYNHFESKEALGAAAIREAFDGAIARLKERSQKAETAQNRSGALEGYIGRYLSEFARDHPGISCPMASLGTDAARHGGSLREEFALGLARYIEAFAAALGEGDHAREESIVILASLIGALTLARACAGTNEALSGEIMAVMRDHLLKHAET
jgi:TetR/AcrR family transcriptional regulator, transcriptional repressor for nem operon